MAALKPDCDAPDRVVELDIFSVEREIWHIVEKLRHLSNDSNGIIDEQLSPIDWQCAAIESDLRVQTAEFRFRAKHCDALN